LAQENRDAQRTLLIITSHGGLVSGLGESGASRVYECLESTAALKRTAGLKVHIYVPDNAARSTNGFMPIEGELSARALREAIADIERGLGGAGPIDYVLIAGGGDVIPFFYLENPAADSDGDFPTDAPYAVAGGTVPPEEAVPGEGPAPAGGDDGGGTDRFLLPDRAVARIPLTAGPGGGLLDYLEMLASEGGPGPARSGRFGLSALEWKTESTRVYEVIGGDDLRTSPPLDTSGFKPEWLAGDGLIYFNVHGSREERFWYGQDGLSYPRVLSPDIVAASSPRRAIVLSEACYGGLVEGKTPADSVAMAFMQGGVSAFVGSSAIAYGSPDRSLTEADLLAYLFFKRLAGGESAGGAFREAKVDFAAEMLERQGYLDGDDRKTLLEFNLFGDPTVGIYRERGPADRSGDMVSEEVLASIMKLARERFPEMEGVRPDISEQTGTAGGAVAKKVETLRPSSTAKGGPRPAGRVFVASFSQTLTVEGRTLERVVRITFREDGRVVKVVTSK
jgi:hypothetical protein